MNNFWTFQIPYVSSQFGADWSPFMTIIDDNVDYVMNKTFELYRLKDPSRMPAQALEYALRLRDIETTPSEALSIKKNKLRNFSTGYRNKGTADLYLDYAEAITGGRGEIFQGYDSGYTAWGLSSWSMGLSEANARVWETPNVVYKVYVEPKVEEPGQAAMEAIEIYLPLAEDSLDVCGNDNDGTATDIIYSDTPDMRMYLPLTADDDDDSDFAVVTTPTDITYGADGAIFNGTSSKINCGNILNSVVGYCFPIEFKRNGVPSGNEYLINIYTDTNNRIMFGVNTSGYLYFQHVIGGSASNVVFYKSLNLCDNVKHKVVLNVISSTTLQITVDDSADTVKTLTGALADLTAPNFYIGGDSTAILFEGIISNVRWFNRNLTTAEITQLYTYNTFTALSKAVAVFNGITSDVACGNVVNNLTGYAISFWFKDNAIPSSAKWLVSNYVDNDNFQTIFVQTDGKVGIYNKVIGVGAIIYTNNNLCDGELHHIVLNIIDSTHIQFIIDGVAGSSQVLTVALTTLTAPTLTLGALTSASTTTVLNGCLSDFILFNRNLTTAEATWLNAHNLDDEFYSKLDDIVDVYRQDFVRPAFYDMYLVNSNMKILRTV